MEKGRRLRSVAFFVLLLGLPFVGFRPPAPPPGGLALMQSGLQRFAGRYFKRYLI